MSQQFPIAAKKALADTSYQITQVLKHEIKDSFPTATPYIINSPKYQLENDDVPSSVHAAVPADVFQGLSAALQHGLLPRAIWSQPRQGQRAN